MSSKNETPALIVALLSTILLLGAGGWWLTRQLNLGNLTLPGTNTPTATNPAAQTPVAERLSMGDRLLVTAGATADKQAGIAAIAAGDWERAVDSLERSLQLQRNDPEALIYLNNARINAQKSYAIAVAVPMDTDVNGSLEILRGVAQAQEDVNQAGGMNGVPLKVAIVNDNGDPQIARQVAQTLVDDEQILGVVGHFSSDMTLAAGEVYNAGELVAISPVSTSVKLSGFSPYVFRTVPSDAFAARALANYMVNQLQQRKAAVFFNSQSAYSQSLKSEFTTSLSLDGGQVVIEFDLSNPAFSPSDSVEQATQLGATVLMLAPNTAQLDRALQVVQVNQGKLELLAGDDVYAPKTLEVGAAAANGMVVAVPWHILSDPQSAFVQRSRQLWGGDVNWRTATAYDAAIALTTALQQNPTRSGIREALSSSSFAPNAATGTLRFMISGDRNQPSQLVVVEPGSRSGYGYDFVPIR